MDYDEQGEQQVVEEVHDGEVENVEIEEGHIEEAEIQNEAEVSYEDEDGNNNEGGVEEDSDEEEFKQDVVQEEVAEEEYADQEEVSHQEEEILEHEDISQVEDSEPQEISQEEDIDKDSTEVGNQDDQESYSEQDTSNDKDENQSPELENEDEASNDVQEESAEVAKSDEEDFDNVVEVEEEKAESDAEDDNNVAQHVSDSENEDENKTEAKLGDVSEDDLRGASSGSDHGDSDVEDNTGNIISPTKKRSAVLSLDDEEEDIDKTTREKHEAAMKMFDSESDNEQKEDGVGDLIADIFGESDDEGEEFTGFGQEEITSKKSKKSAISDDSDSDEDQQPQPEVESDDDEGFKAPKPSKKSKVQDKDEGSDSNDEGVIDSGTRGMSDFDIMLAKKKEENRSRRRRKDGGTFISDADDIINAMLTKMKEAAEADREANQRRKPALKKLKMLGTVIMHLKKQNLKEAFVDNGVIAAIADWLSLLPDRSLPHITIRTELLKVLHDLPPVGSETLKHSGIGKSVMILFKHPKEIRSNKESAGRLINKWSRPIFGLNENFKSMSREEREQRDLEQMPQAKRRRLSSGVSKNQAEDGRPEGELGQLRPGEVGFVMRARVPMPSTKDYVVRPKWNVEQSGMGDDDDDEPAAIAKRRRSAGAPRSSKKDERLEKHLRNFAEKRKSSKLQRAVKISIEGNKMSIL